MSSTHPSRRRGPCAAVVAAALVIPATGGLAAPASAAVAPDAPVIIDEVYGGGGNSGAAFNQDFVELYNASDEAVSLDGWSLQYASAAGSWANGSQTDLVGQVPPGGSFLVGQAFGADTTKPALPTPDLTGTVAMSGSGAKIALVRSTDRLTCSGTACAAADDVVDLVGWGSSANAYAGTAPAPGTTNATSVARDEHAHTADNGADFTAGVPTPTAGGTGPGPDPDPDPEPRTATIAEIQGTGSASPLAGSVVTTTGVVTAAYPTGGFGGLYLQTAGTGGDPADDATPGASDGVFVFSRAAAADLAVGDHVEVTGEVSEYEGLTEITADSWTVLDGPGEVTPLATGWPATDAGREALEGMLLAPQGDFTVTDNYDTNYYGTITLAAGDSPLVQPTTAGRPGSAEAAAQAQDNAARTVLLDDGSSTNYSSTANKGLPLPWLTGADPVRVGAAVTFTTPVVLDYRYGAWGLQPRTQLTPDVAEEVQPATFEDTREQSPQDVGGTLTVGTFNVLNYFTTTGDELTGCTYYTDRDGDPVTVRGGCDARGAAEDEDLERQQAKLVAAISTLGADVVALEEIENSAHFGADRDQALSDLVAALDAHDGAGTWAFVPSPAAVPADEDVIRNAFIYRTAGAEPLGSSRILDDPVAFGNARQPLAQVFQPAGGVDADQGDDVVVITNHFKSKGSAGPWPGDQDTGDGQGSSNESRVRQATALAEFADDVAAHAGTDAVLLVGDFNAYEQEDPIVVLTEAGYTDLGPATGEYSYVFDGMVGSLDHVLASPAAAEAITGADIWNINAVEPIANEYSRFNYNVSNLYDTTPFRSSDHDPFLVGLDLTPSADAWEKRATYTHGDRVVHGEGLFEALWWTRGDVPGATPYGAWAEVGAPVVTEAGTVPTWTDTWVYGRGDVVVHDGHRFQARWYSRHVEPRASLWGPWEDLGAL
ncbi:ExeM/NucH family extracellular endonuclease [Isoptericola sp. NEAU-Y5]|uniref:ExeM/NucH family extracellular endonuclease n=1 Tax=Isoptericola luteus TaxID=2879484 RepID=A0ABS7ZE48_9MICO|nr:ExeM/NucH family extracellular endonuclease [Isoptericola sp. NEAU-Y5]MCA5892099.1 ExeM/NucH family extracellular endonuclease [Isoptericola sp. NEAU-Y5]